VFDPTSIEEDDDGPDSLTHEQKPPRKRRCQDMNAEEGGRGPTTTAMPSSRNDFNPGMYTMQEESQRRMSPIRKTRVNAAKTISVPKTISSLPLPVLNLVPTTVPDPVNRNEHNKSRPSASAQANHRGMTNATAGRSVNKAPAPSSSIARLLVSEDAPSTPPAEGLASTSYIPQPLLPAAHIKESYPTHYSFQSVSAQAPEPSSASQFGLRPSVVVHKHRKNIAQRRKQMEALDDAEAQRVTRAEKFKEDARMRRREHHALVERRSIELQKEMELDLGDLPPPGEPPQKYRWRTFYVGEPMYAPRYVTPEPIIKTEEEEVQLDSGSPEAEDEDVNEQHGQGHVDANLPTNRGYDKEDEESELYYDEIAGDGELSDRAAQNAAQHVEEFVRAHSGSPFNEVEDADENTHREFIFGGSDLRQYDGPRHASTPGATNGSYSPRKSKYGERYDSPEETSSEDMYEEPPTKRRRTATREPVAGPSSHPKVIEIEPRVRSPIDVPRSLALPTKSSARVKLTQRRSRVAAAQAKALDGTAQYVHDPDLLARRGVDGKVPQEHLTSEERETRRLEMHRMHVVLEDGDYGVPAPGFGANFRGNFRPGSASSDLENDPIALPVCAELLPSPSFLTSLLAHTQTASIPSARPSTLSHPLRLPSTRNVQTTGFQAAWTAIT